MITQQMLDYIRQQTAAGRSQEEIKTSLRQSGWQEADIDEGMRAFASGQTTASQTSTQPLPKASEILKEAWAAYKQRMGTYIAVSIAPVLSILAISFILGPGSIFLLLTSGKTDGNGVFGIGLGVIIIVAILAIAIGTWGTVAELTIIRDRTQGIGFKDAFMKSTHLILPFLGTSILVGLAVMGGLILLVVPGIIFALWFGMTSYIIVAEGLSGPAALSRSKYYVQGRIGLGASLGHDHRRIH